MSAPERIWAMPSDDGWMSPYCGNAPHDGSTEYVRADLCDPTQDARVKRLADFLEHEGDGLHVSTTAPATLRALSAERDALRATVKMLHDLDGISVETVQQLTAERDALKAELAEAVGVTQLVEAAIAEDTAANKHVTSRERKQYIRGRIEALKDLRAALRALEQGNP